MLHNPAGLPSQHVEHWRRPSVDQRHDSSRAPINLPEFFMDEAQVTNAEYERFLKATGYRPTHLENFLKHWPNGQMPAERAGHPVVYVDLNDARAYALAGKRLPTEEEWHLAAHGTDDEPRPGAKISTHPNAIPEGTLCRSVHFPKGAGEPATVDQRLVNIQILI